MTDASAALQGRTRRLLSDLGSMGSVLVAFSGGVDSAFVLAAAVRALGAEHVIAATAVSPSLAASELAGARAFARNLAVVHATPATNELGNADYRANSGRRCYFCKSEVLDVLQAFAVEQGIAHVVTGTNADDAVDPFRPGIKAADERGVLAPLRAAGFTKADVRQMSREWGLATWDKPAMPCLASRIAYGVDVTSHRLRRVEAAEAALRDACARAGVPVRDLRVRDLGGRVRIEVDEDRIGAVAGLLGSDAGALLRAAGFRDEESAGAEVSAFRSGALNEERLRGATPLARADEDEVTV